MYKKIKVSRAFYFVMLLGYFVLFFVGIFSMRFVKKAGVKLGGIAAKKIKQAAIAKLKKKVPGLGQVIDAVTDKTAPAGETEVEPLAAQQETKSLNKQQAKVVSLSAQSASSNISPIELAQTQEMAAKESYFLKIFEISLYERSILKLERCLRDSPLFLHPGNYALKASAAAAFAQRFEGDNEFRQLLIFHLAFDEYFDQLIYLLLYAVANTDSMLLKIFFFIEPIKSGQEKCLILKRIMKRQNLTLFAATKAFLQSFYSDKCTMNRIIAGLLTFDEQELGNFFKFIFPLLLQEKYLYFYSLAYSKKTLQPWLEPSLSSKLENVYQEQDPCNVLNAN